MVTQKRFRLAEKSRIAIRPACILWARPPIIPRGIVKASADAVKSGKGASKASQRSTPRTIQQGSAEYKTAGLKHIKPGRIEEYQRQGKINAHQAKDGGSRTELYQDKWGNIYEAVKARQGAGKTIYEPTVDNVKASGGNQMLLFGVPGEPA